MRDIPTDVGVSDSQQYVPGLHVLSALLPFQHNANNMITFQALRFSFVNNTCFPLYSKYNIFPLARF